VTTRREFLSVGAAAAGLAALGGSRPRAEALSAASRDRRAAPDGGRAAHPLRLLILGGTSFLGPHQINYALGRGHSVSTFTRGRTEPSVHQDLMDEVEMLIGDRDNDLEALRGRSWDAVLDNSGRQVEWTRATAELLRDTVETYLYVSSTGVYYPYLEAGISEDTQPRLELPPDVAPGDDGAFDYGIMKANSELAAREIFGDDRVIAVRPGYMMGPGDPTDRFTYWPVRLAMGGEVLVPGPGDQVQYIDIRDVASWMIRLVEQKAAGTWNAVGPEGTVPMLQFVHGAHAAFSVPATFTVVDDQEFLTEHGVRYAVPWIMPAGNNYGSAMIDNRRALENGLTLTPLARSVRDIHDWWVTDAMPAERKEAMLSGERSMIAAEQAILADWHARG